MLDWERNRDSRALTLASVNEVGYWVAAMAPWQAMITLTHAPIGFTSKQPFTSRSHRSGSSSYTRVGLNAHNSLVRHWFYEVVRPSDRTAQLWGETELHVSGQPHEHLLLAHAESAPVFSWLDAWYRAPRGGIWHSLSFSTDPSIAVRAACYVEKAAKYVGKMACQPPKVFGFGLHEAESHSTTWTR